VSDPVISTHTAGGEVEVPVYLADATRALHLRFLSGGLVQDELDLPLSHRLFPGHIVGTTNLTTRARAALSELLLPQEPVRVVVAPVPSWPTSPLSYGGLSALVVTDPGPVLSPLQTTALRAWIASGGRLLVVDPRSGDASLVALVGRVPGWGWVKTTAPVDRPQAWQALLGLVPYGQTRTLGSDFDPVARGVPPQGSSMASPAVALLTGWALVVSLVLVLRRKRSLGPAVAAAVVTSALVVGLWAGGTFPWDQGLSIHGRELVLPGALGRFTSWEALPSSGRAGPLGWPEGSPWALAKWKNGIPEGQLVKAQGPDRVSLGSFLPAVDRTARYRVRWDGTGLRWLEQTGGGWVGREEGPAELTPDGPWLAKMTAGWPDTVWSVGLEGSVCWLRPELEGGSP